MTELYSQARADLYDMAYDMPPDALIPVSEMKPHLVEMLHSRICPDEPPPDHFTAKAVRDNLAPTFSEARDIALYREATLMYAAKMLEGGHKFMKRYHFSVEIVDFLYDHLPPEMRDRDEFEIAHVVPLLRPHYEELVAEARRGSHDQLPRWQKMPHQKRRADE